jgi:2-oxoglutarate ferredoxin oxidoreductase subunit alpha
MDKQKKINQEAEKFEMFKIYGDNKSKNVIISWGSTAGAILDVLNENKIDAKFIQALYIDPFSKKIETELKDAKKILVIENNASSPLSQLIAEKTGVIIEDKCKILRYDGRPFLSDELAKEIKARLR